MVLRIPKSFIPVKKITVCPSLDYTINGNWQTFNQKSAKNLTLCLIHIVYISGTHHTAGEVTLFLKYNYST